MAKLIFSDAAPRLPELFVMIPSFRAFVLAPAVVPLVYAALFMPASSTGPFPVFGFLFVFMPAAVFSYAVTLLCFLPSL